MVMKTAQVFDDEKLKIGSAIHIFEKTTTGVIIAEYDALIKDVNLNRMEIYVYKNHIKEQLIFAHEVLAGDFEIKMYQ